MSKRAEEAALKAYPKRDVKGWSSAFGAFEFDGDYDKREGYKEGYEQAERDLADAFQAEYAKELVKADVKALVEAVEQYVEPRPGTPYMHRTKILAIKNRVKELLK